MKDCHVGRSSLLPEQNLTLLDMGKNSLAKVDECALGQLTALKEINLQLNKLTELPESLGMCVCVSVYGCLSVRACALNALCPGKCTALTSLSVPINRFTAFPMALQALSNLQSLDLSHNRLTAVPPTIVHLTNLTSLNVVGNDLKQLPPQLGSCIRLTHLNVRPVWSRLLVSNPLLTLPRSFFLPLLFFLRC